MYGFKSLKTVTLRCFCTSNLINMMLMITNVVLLTLLLRSTEGISNATQVEDPVTNSEVQDNLQGLPCCITNGLSFASFSDAIQNLTNNTVVNITGYAVLSCIVNITGFDNITIIGQGNPIVNCNGTGALNFVSCSNVTIEGISWHRCGSSGNSTYPGIKFSNSSNVLMQNSSFLNSTGQAVKLSKLSGNVSLNNCQFTQNSYNQVHGAALYYSRKAKQYIHLQLIIFNCTFSYNTAVGSVVYFGSSKNDPNVYLSIQSSVFRYNQGASIYISNNALHLKGDMVFEHNVAFSGGAIFSNSSLIFCNDNHQLKFYNNSAKVKGGAICLNNSKIHFGESFMISFNNNNAFYGGAIYSLKSTVLFGKHSVPSFEGNKAVFQGEKYCKNCDTMFNGSSKVEFSKNTAISGGAVYSYNTALLFDCKLIVTFTYNTATFGEGGAVYSKWFSELSFNENTTVTFRGNFASTYGGAVYSFQYCNIVFNGNSVLVFHNNVANYGGAVYSQWHSALSFDRNMTLHFVSNFANINGGAVNSFDHCSVMFNGNSLVNFYNNHASFGGAVYSAIRSDVSFNENSTVTFHNNSAKYGGAVYSTQSCYINFDRNSTVTFCKNTAKYGGAVLSVDLCDVLFHGSTTVIFKYNSDTYGGALYSGSYSNISFIGKSMVTFEDNTARQDGGALHLINNIDVSFTDHAIVEFINNSVKFNDNYEKFGGAVSCILHCDILFDGYSNVLLSMNNAQYGGAIISKTFSSIRFDGNSTVIFNGNVGRGYGGAVNIREHCNIVFDGQSEVIFYNNKGAQFGGATMCFINSSIIFQGNTNVTFEDNYALSGGAMKCLLDSEIIFREATNVLFINNSALSGGALDYSRNSTTSVGGNAIITFINNYATDGGGAVNLHNNLNASFTEHSNIKFIDNRARHGSAINCYTYCNVSFDGSSIVMFSNNRVHSDGTVKSAFYSSISFGEKSKVKFAANNASYGGAIMAESHSDLLFYGSSHVVFSDNSAINGGAITSDHHSSVSFRDNTNVIFKNNYALHHGGAVEFLDRCNIKFYDNVTVAYEGNSAGLRGGAVFSHNNTLLFSANTKVTFSGNHAKCGGVMFLFDNTYSSFTGNTVVIFEDNLANETGGGIHCHSNCNITFDENSTVTFDDNKAAEGGAMFINKFSHLLFTDSTKAQFRNNKAIKGGAITVQHSSIEFAKHSFTIFTYNTATRNGGGIYLIGNFNTTFENDSNLIFYQNNASHLGGAIFGELKKKNQSKILLKSKSVDFSENAALVGDNVYIQMASSCDETCLDDVIGLNTTHNYPPRRLAFNNPATCINTTSRCPKYFISNIMLGQNIKINACVLSFYDEQAGGVNFVVTGESKHHRLDGTRFVPIACTFFEGISVVGKKISNKKNFSISITSYTNSEVEISVELTVELSPCHPGFYYDNSTQKCECYDGSNIVACSGSISTIKRGYWFGIVDGKTTVVHCPNTYCNFTCCETTNGYYQLSPVRADQCSSHRSDTACGSCENGYTLAFDSANCIDSDKCTAGQTALVIILSIIYYIVLVVVVFVVTYHRVEIGYFYVITYYYSILDILLGQNLYASQGLYTVVSIVSSAAKVTPQFLGQLCLVKNLSGIDQQVIHYVHPLAVTIIVGIISQSAKMSHRFSAFISRGIIRTICFLLLLSYTSVATTSLLLLRSLTFHNVDKIYTYLSPDIEYFHGRHLPYGIIAILCTLVIVIGLPLLLLLEPFLNRKINFYRIKPLLDQFQGCYKDRYRLFASYYMIGRLLIIIILITNSANNNTSQILILVTSTLLALTQLLIKPYKHKILNIFDGVVLHIIIFVSFTSFVDSFSTGVLVSVIILLMVLPLIIFVAMEGIVHKENIRKILGYHKPKPVVADDRDEPPPVNDIGLVIDNDMRKNATIVDM